MGVPVNGFPEGEGLVGEPAAFGMALKAKRESRDIVFDSDSSCAKILELLAPRRQDAEWARPAGQNK